MVAIAAILGFGWRGFGRGSVMRCSWKIVNFKLPLPANRTELPAERAAVDDGPGSGRRTASVSHRGGRVDTTRCTTGRRACGGGPFDIDGTSSPPTARGKRAITRADGGVRHTGPINGYAFGGRTTPRSSATAARRRAGRPGDRRRPTAIWFATWRTCTARCGRMRIHRSPACGRWWTGWTRGRRDGAGLLTRNIAGARGQGRGGGAALRALRVGDTAATTERPELPAIAVERARHPHGVEYAGKEIVIIGDTPKEWRRHPPGRAHIATPRPPTR